MTDKKKDGRVNNGGTRAGSGKKLLYGEKTKVVGITWKVPLSKIETFKKELVVLRKKGNALLKTYIKKKQIMETQVTRQESKRFSILTIVNKILSIIFCNCLQVSESCFIFVLQY